MSSEVETSLAVVLRNPSTAFRCASLRSGWQLDELSLQIRKQRRMCFLISERFGAALAFFHDEFVERGIDRQGIFPRKTGETEAIRWLPGGLDHSFDIEVAKTIDAEVSADFFHRHLIRDQFFRIGKINSVMTGEAVRGAAHAHVHFL